MYQSIESTNSAQLNVPNNYELQKAFANNINNSIGTPMSNDSQNIMLATEASTSGVPLSQLSNDNISYTSNTSQQSNNQMNNINEILSINEELQKYNNSHPEDNLFNMIDTMPVTQQMPLTQQNKKTLTVKNIEIDPDQIKYMVKLFIIIVIIYYLFSQSFIKKTIFKYFRITPEDYKRSPTKGIIIYAVLISLSIVIINQLINKN